MQQVLDAGLGFMYLLVFPRELTQQVKLFAERLPEGQLSFCSHLGQAFGVYLVILGLITQAL